MDRRQKVELFEEIRRGYAAGETIQGLSKKHGVHRRMVRQAISSAMPPDRKKNAGTAEAGTVKEHIERMLSWTVRHRANSGTQRTDLDAPAEGASGAPHRGSHGSPLCTAAKA